MFCFTKPSATSAAHTQSCNNNRNTRWDSSLTLCSLLLPPSPSLMSAVAVVVSFRAESVTAQWLCVFRVSDSTGKTRGVSQGPPWDPGMYSSSTNKSDFFFEYSVVTCSVPEVWCVHSHPSRLCVYTQPPLTDSAELSRRPVRLLGINTWDVAAALTHLDWNLFKSIHEVRTYPHTVLCKPGLSNLLVIHLICLINIWVCN